MGWLAGVDATTKRIDVLHQAADNFVQLVQDNNGVGLVSFDQSAYPGSISEFFAHETRGKCIPCREGTPWLAKTVRRIEHGEGREEDLPLLLDICDNILGRAFCALGDFATSNIVASVKYFFDDYEQHIRLRGCPFG
jgi:NADH-ubiquinone oxidoreductase-F iron-sulfur binding region